MPRFVLSQSQVATLHHLAELGRPGPGSPLGLLVPGDPLPPGDPEVRDLQTKSLLQPGRVNGLFLQYLAAALNPEELIQLGVADLDIPGFTVLRVGEFWTECTVASDGSVAFDFPTTRNAVLAAISSALSGGAAEDGSGNNERFAFVGRVDDAFVLQNALQAWRGGSEAVDVDSLVDEVMKTAVDAGSKAGLEYVGGSAQLDALATDRNAVDAAIGRLLGAGHLVTLAQGLAPSQAARDALSESPIGGFNLVRSILRDGALVRSRLTVMRTPAGTLIHRIRHVGEDTLVEWREVSERQLRTIALATCLDEEGQAGLAQAVQSGGLMPQVSETSE